MGQKVQMACCDIHFAAGKFIVSKFATFQKQLFGESKNALEFVQRKNNLIVAFHK